MHVYATDIFIEFIHMAANRTVVCSFHRSSSMFRAAASSAVAALLRPLALPAAPKALLLLVLPPLARLLPLPEDVALAPLMSPPAAESSADTATRSSPAPLPCRFDALLAPPLPLPVEVTGLADALLARKLGRRCAAPAVQARLQVSSARGRHPCYARRRGWASSCAAGLVGGGRPSWG